MQDNNLPTTNPSDSSHVDDYQPPQPAVPQTDDHQPFSAPAAPTVNSDNNDLNIPKVVEEKIEDKVEAVVPEPVKIEDKKDTSEVEIKNSPIKEIQSLETQNIFVLLGVSDGSADEKESFLDELQEVIWEDFIDNDVSLLLNETQIDDLKKLKEKGKDIKIQEEILVYLEKIIPDMEDMMMDKALELKEDMVLERISGMKEFYNSKPEALKSIMKAEEAISNNKWADAGKLLNEIK